MRRPQERGSMDGVAIVVLVVVLGLVGAGLAGVWVVLVQVVTQQGRILLRLDELAQKAFVHLEGVSDEWLRGLQVERLADGRFMEGLDIRQFADALQRADGPGNCCKRK